MPQPFFKTTVGVFGNGSGLPEVAPGSRSIPASLLNNVGRSVDSARINPTEGIPMTRTPGGSSIDFNAIIEAAQAVAQLLPFQVIPQGVEAGAIVCIIGEGRIFGRADWERGDYFPGIPSATYSIPSLGVAGLDPSFAGEPVSNQGTNTPKNPAANSTSGGGGSSGVSNTANPSQGGTQSGNAGSIMNWSHQDAIHNQPQGNGNAGSVMDWNTPFSSWTGSNLPSQLGEPNHQPGSVINWTHQSGIHNNPTK